MSDSDRQREAYLKLQYLKAVARVQYEHREFLGNTDQKLLPNGLRIDDLQGQINFIKRGTLNVTFKDRNTARITNAIFNLMPQMRNISLAVNVGGQSKAQRSLFKVIITVGYMWHYKVNLPIYIETKRNFHRKLILSAERVRLNSKDFILYEVKTFDWRSGDIAMEFVAQAKHTEKRHTALASTPHKAIQAVKAMMSKDINEVMGIN